MSYCWYYVYILMKMCEDTMYEIIFNPGSKSNNSNLIWETVEKYLLKNEITYHLNKTKGPHHAKELAHKITSDGNEHTIIVIGGDGTLNEVVNGLYDPDKVTLGLIPSGSGNDFAKATGISTIPEEAITTILNCTEDQKSLVNYGEMHAAGRCHRFLISCGCGFDSDVCVDVQTSKLKPMLNKIGLGKLTYTIVALAKLIKMSVFSAHFNIDDNNEYDMDKMFFLTAMNTIYEGGGYMFCPDASPCDDKLDLLTVHSMTRKRIIPLLPKAKKGKHVGAKGIDIQPISSVDMSFSKPVNVHTDGEVIGSFDKVRIECAKKHIKFCLPEIKKYD